MFGGDSMGKFIVDKLMFSVPFFRNEPVDLVVGRDLSQGHRGQDGDEGQSLCRWNHLQRRRKGPNAQSEIERMTWFQSTSAYLSQYVCLNKKFEEKINFLNSALKSRISGHASCLWFDLLHYISVYGRIEACYAPFYSFLTVFGSLSNVGHRPFA